MITAEINPIKKLSRLILKPIRTNTINNLSAIGSRISPNTDSEFVFLQGSHQESRKKMQ